MGFIALAISLASFPALLSGSSGLKTPRKARKLVDMAAFQDRLFVVFTCASFTCFLGYIIPYFYIPTYAQDHLGVSPSFALYILVIAIAASFFGRLSSGYVAHYAGNMLTWMACALVSGILSLCWIGIKSEKSFIAFSVLWGKFPLDLNSRLIHYLVDRLLLCWSCYTAWFCLSQYMPGPLAPGYSTRHVLGIFLHCIINRGAYRWGLAYKIRLSERKRVHQLSRGANLERSVPFARVGSSCHALDYDNSETEQRHFHISHLPKAEKRSQSFTAPPGRCALPAA